MKIDVGQSDTHRSPFRFYVYLVFVHFLLITERFYFLNIIRFANAYSRFRSISARKSAFFPRIENPSIVFFFPPLLTLNLVQGYLSTCKLHMCISNIYRRMRPELKFVVNMLAFLLFKPSRALRSRGLHNLAIQKRWVKDVII